MCWTTSTGAARPPTGETTGDAAGPGAYRPYPVIFRETVLPRIFRETVLPGLAGQAHDEALEILSRLEPPASAPAPDASTAPRARPHLSRAPPEPARLGRSAHPSGNSP